MASSSSVDAMLRAAEIALAAKKMQIARACSGKGRNGATEGRAEELPSSC